jgi:DNA-binding MarR family transcriptional regulator
MQSMTTTAAPPDLADHLRLVVTRLARRLRQQADADTSPTQLAALSTIERRGPLTLGDLAASERVQPPTITAAVDRLEQRDLVRRSTDATDRRVVRVEITAAGRKLLARHRSRKTAYLARRLDALEPRDRAVLEEAVEILDRVMEEPQ